MTHGLFGDKQRHKGFCNEILGNNVLCSMFLFENRRLAEETMLLAYFCSFVLSYSSVLASIKELR